MRVTEIVCIKPPSLSVMHSAVRQPECWGRGPQPCVREAYEAELGHPEGGVGALESHQVQVSSECVCLHGLVTPAE